MRSHFPLIDFGGWCRRRPRNPTPPLRRRRVHRQRRRPGPAGTVVPAVFVVAASVVLAGASERVLIQEILYDGPGTDADDVFTELCGPPGSSLDGWSLVGINGGTGNSYRTVDLTGATVPADGILVVATTSANDSLAAVRDVVGSVDWQNGPDAVHLVDSTGTVVDALQYGDAGAFNAGEGAPAMPTSGGESLSRDRSGTDTDNNLVDFARLAEPTPGTGPVASVDDAGDEDDEDGPETVPEDAGIEPPIRVSLPDTTAFGGDTLTVPVRFTDTSGLGLLASELFLTFDGDLLSYIDVAPADLVDTLHWQLAAHAVEADSGSVDTLRIALATDVDTLAGGGALVQARFLVADLRRPAASRLEIEHMALNDGGTVAAVEDGEVGLVGVDATITTWPLPLVMHDSLHLEVNDPDVDVDPADTDTLVIDVFEGGEQGPVDQVETLRAVETGPSSGIFSASVAIAYADPVSASGVVETAPRRQVELCFDDSLDAGGVTTRRCTVLAVPAHDGRLSTTVVAEPGDTLWFRLVDPDLNRQPAQVDTATIHVVAPVTADSHTATLIEIGPSDSVFFGHLATRSTTAPSDSLRLELAGGDTLEPYYLDHTPTEGDSGYAVAATHVLGRFGDADGNERLQAFDATQILTHVLDPRLSTRDSLAANVDSLGPFGVITPYDAALVLQQRVGLRRRFPVQASTSANHPRPHADVRATPGAASRPATVDRRLELRERADHVAVWLDDRSGIVAGDVLLQWEEELEARIAPGRETAAYLFAARPRREPSGIYTVRVVLAGATPAGGAGELFRLYPRRENGLGSAALVSASFNDGRITARASGSATTVSGPRAFALYGNHPNPFNAGTVIAFELAESGPAQLEVLDLLGQRVRRLVAEERRAGAHRVRWDGLDEAGRPAATGVYLSRLRVGGAEGVGRMLLLR